MTVSSSTSRADYNGNGVTTVFTVPFYFIDNAHLILLSTVVATGVSTTLTLNSDYTLSGAGVSSGGTATLSVAPASGVKLSILRNLPFTQLYHYVPNDPFPAASHETNLDLLTMEAQQLNESVSRAIILPPATTGVSTSLPAPIAGNWLGWDATATKLINIAATVAASVSSYMATVLLAANALAARTLLGSAASGANTDITSLSSPSIQSATAVTQSGNDNSTKVATTAYADRAGRARNLIANGGCEVYQDKNYVASVSGTYGYSPIDMGHGHSGALTGTTVSGTLTRSTASPSGIKGYSSRWSAVTTTGAGSVVERIRLRKEDAINMKNLVASFQVKAYQDTGGTLTYTVAINKANAVDDFTAVTSIASTTFSVPNTTSTQIKYENISMGDCSNGVEIIITAALPSAVSSKNFDLTEFQIEQNTGCTLFEIVPYAQTLMRCQRCFNTSYPAGSAPGSVTDASGSLMHVAINTGDFYSFGAFRLPVKMAGTPVVTGYNPITGTSGQFRGITDSSNAATCSFLFSNDSGVGQTTCPSLNMTATRAYAIHYTADARLPL